MNTKSLVTLTSALAVGLMLSVSAQTPPAPPQTGTAKSSGSADLTFIRTAASAGLAEVELGRVGVEKAESADVKQFAQRMVDDHGRANNELQQLAASKNITLPSELDAKHKAARDRLSKLSGAAFDRSFMREMTQGHTAAVTAFDREAKMGKDSQVKDWATQKLPTLREHQAQAKDINAKIAAGTSGKGAAKKPGK
jgi:putative membrane protein